MENHLNFQNFGNEPPGNNGGDGGNIPPGNFPLTRQSSIYSLTFDEFQSSLNKDFGSMNMDELLKTIWAVEETQSMAFTSGGGGGANPGAADAFQNGLQRQGSLTLPRTLSLKTVDEVWKDLSKEITVSMGGSNDSIMPQRQQTLGEITLEEFLVRAGVVKEETLAAGNADTRFFGNINNAGLPIGFQQDSSRVSNFMGNGVQDISNQVNIQPCNLPLDVNGATLNQQQRQILPKQPILGYGNQLTQIPIQGNAQLGSPSIRNGIVGIRDQGLGNNTGLVQNAVFEGGNYSLAGGLQGVVTTTSPVTPLSSDGMGNSNGESSSASPGAYSFGGGFRGRRSSNAVEKAAERRQRRMIKNRESAARSRARKQAHTTELEAEIAKLRAENEELKRNQDEMMKQQKNQVTNQKNQVEMMKQQKNQATKSMNAENGHKKRLRRSQSGP